MCIQNLYLDTIAYLFIIIIMGIYKYQAKKGPAEIISATMEAESTDEVVNKLTQQGFFPIQVEPLVGFKESSVKAGGFFGAVRAREVNVFTRQLASLIRAGVPLLRALNVIVEQTESTNLKNIIAQVVSEVKDGRLFSEALARYPKIFPPLYSSLIKAGEDSGSLDKVLIRLADHREKMEVIKSQIRSALIYPSVILVVGILTVAIMMVMVVPQLRSVFNTMGQSLPWTTELLLGISDFIRVYWYVVVGAIFFILLIGRGLILIEKEVFDEMKLNFPMIGNFLRKSELGKFSRTLGLLLNTGIPILAAMEITIPTISNLILQKEFKRVADGLKGGTSFANGLKQNGKYFPLFMVNMVAVGEESGSLDETLAEVSNYYERETEENIKKGLALVEPVLLLGMGLVVGFIVISMLLPLLTMGTMMQ